MQATIKPGSTPRTIDVYLKPSASFSQRDELMTFVLAIPATVLPSSSMGSSGLTENGLGPVSGITGLQPSFLVNNLGSTMREVFVSTATINNQLFYTYNFLFAGTSSYNHDWVADTEQQIFSIQFNGSTSNSDPDVQSLINLPSGGAEGISYWYFQPNTLGDITNYTAPFYGNPFSTAPQNGASTTGAALSLVSLSNPVSLSMTSIVPTVFMDPQGETGIKWEVATELGAKQYEVEKSTDGRSFASVAIVNATGNNSLKAAYNWIDENATSSNTSYRIKGTSSTGQVEYSKIINVSALSSRKGFEVYPNPINGGLINLRFNNTVQGMYTVRLLNSAGYTLLSKTILYTGKSNTEAIQFDNSIAKGNYVLEITGPGNSRQSIKLIK
jgi:hypothetical protein